MKTFVQYKRETKRRLSRLAAGQRLLHRLMKNGLEYIGTVFHTRFSYMLFICYTHCCDSFGMT